LGMLAERGGTGRRGVSRLGMLGMLGEPGGEGWRGEQFGYAA
jgi:hypothetical protein